MSWLGKLIEEHKHEIEAIIMPGFILSIASVLTLNPFNMSWTEFNQDSLLSIFTIIIGTFVIGYIAYKFGNIIEEVIIEKILNLDLKRISKISWIVSKAKEAQLIKDHSLIKNNNTSEEKWYDLIKATKKKLKGKKEQLQLKYNRHHKFCRSCIADILLFILVLCYKYGTIFILNNFIIMLVAIFLILIFYKGMYDSEKRELQIIYDEL